MQVAKDLDVIADAFGTAPPKDRLVQQCLGDLQPLWYVLMIFCLRHLKAISNITNDICKWAYDQVVRGFSKADRFTHLVLDK